MPCWNFRYCTAVQYKRLIIYLFGFWKIYKSGHLECGAGTTYVP